MSNKGRAIATRAEKHNGVKKERQRGDKAVRDAMNAMHAEAAEETAEVATNDQDGKPEDGDDAGG